ncbi:MAG TPA: DNA repair ATPase, partial [Myxococcota bacterium]
MVSAAEKKPAGASVDVAAGGAYDIIKARLDEHGRALQQKIEALNHKRLALFGGSELAVLGNERVRTENNCVPRDILAVGHELLFGYNVFIGLKKETRVDDVLALHKLEKSGDSAWNLDALPLPAWL